MKVSIAQLNYTIGDFAGNSNKIIASIDRAKCDGADIVVFSEQAISGVSACDLLKNIDFLDNCNESLQEIATHCQNITALVGFPMTHKGRTISALAVIQNCRIVSYIGKQCISDRDEAFWISQSKGCEYIEVGDKHVAVLLGDDVHFEKEYGERADLIINCNKSSYCRGIIETRYDYFSRKAYEMKKPLITVNHVGGDTSTVYDGTSAAYDAQGSSIAILHSFREDFQTIDFSVQNPHVPLLTTNKTVNVYNAIKLGLEDYFTKNGFKKACLGLSGGVDSAVVAALCAETLGTENVHVLLMPSQFSSDHSVDDAVQLAENLGIKYDIVPISSVYDQVNDALSNVFNGSVFDITEENIQSRIRGLMLMALSNKFGYILLNTTNKSEAAVGYGTLYGDTNGSLSILGDLYKTEVFELARYINRNEEIIPQNSIDKAPSAELRPDQKDSDSLPDYEVLDSVLYRLIEKNQSVEEISEAGFEESEVRDIVRMVQRTEYKRYQLCPVLKLSTCVLGRDRIMPLTCKYQF